MSSPDQNQDAITEEEISGAAAAVPASPLSTGSKRNAFTELMSKKLKIPTTIKNTKKDDMRIIVFNGRDGLGAYTHDPTAFPPSRVLYFDDNYVAINDLFPKSSVHTLLLPRSPKNLLHPFEAFEDPEFLAGVQDEVAKLRKFVAKELQRKYGKFSAQERARERALNGEDDVPDGEDLPPGRDWDKDVMVGVHAHPSMSHLHVHVLSTDRFSEFLKHKKHYNSFSTPFLVDVKDFPLAQDDVRRSPGHENYLNWDLKCWRCGKNFSNHFSKLKSHLAEEFENWKAM